jgi:hypothetical protein
MTCLPRTDTTRHLDPEQLEISHARSQIRKKPEFRESDLAHRSLRLGTRDQAKFVGSTESLEWRKILDLQAPPKLKGGVLISDHKTADAHATVCESRPRALPPTSLSRQSSAWPMGGSEGSDVALDGTGAEG